MGLFVVPPRSYGVLQTPVIISLVAASSDEEMSNRLNLFRECHLTAWHTAQQTGLYRQIYSSTVSVSANSRSTAFASEHI
ncbi:unnamed protein product [Angiostrongylus costaricensis]|uniref:Uncharacterized protein n=1 Tax=Angiostrongylus costaricensis TaxID=334426 RepID=A0A0R3PQQ1_ANGCS|nr:unnamed protein product [Angiostrongylus costaricensis]